MVFKKVYILPEQKDIIDAMKIHPNQATHEIVAALIWKSGEYDKCCRSMENDNK